MRPPAYLLKAGINALPCIGDGRQSGTSGSPSILNASPEAAAGGGLALLRTGDRVRIDLKQRHGQHAAAARKSSPSAAKELEAAGGYKYPASPDALAGDPARAWSARWTPAWCWKRRSSIRRLTRPWASRETIIDPLRPRLSRSRFAPAPVAATSPLSGLRPQRGGRSCCPSGGSRRAMRRSRLKEKGAGFLRRLFYSPPLSWPANAGHPDEAGVQFTGTIANPTGWPTLRWAMTVSVRFWSCTPFASGCRACRCPAPSHRLPSGTPAASCQGPRPAACRWR